MNQRCNGVACINGGPVHRVDVSPYRYLVEREEAVHVVEGQAGSDRAEAVVRVNLLDGHRWLIITGSTRTGANQRRDGETARVD